MTYLTKTKSGGVFAEMQIITYIFINRKAYSDKLTISKVIDAKSPIVIFWEQTPVGKTLCC